MTTITIRQVQLKCPWAHVAHHKFPFPDPGDPGFYRLATSLNAFFSGKKRRNRTPDFLFTEVNPEGRVPSDWEARHDAALPVHEHASLYEFFEAIGYNMKTKKFLTNKQHEQ